jgi:hypothetical protein
MEAKQIEPLSNYILRLSTPAQHYSAPFSPALKPILGNFDFVKLSRLALMLYRHVSYCTFNQQQIQFAPNHLCNSN